VPDTPPTVDSDHALVLARFEAASRA